MARRKTSAQLKELAAAAERREAAARATRAAKPLPADGSAARSREFDQYIYHSLWSRAIGGNHLPYLVDAVPADVTAAGGPEACGITLVTATTPDASKMGSIRNSGISPTRIFWYRGRATAVYRRTKSGGVSIQYYEGRASNDAEPVRSHHSVPISSATPASITIDNITDRYDAIFKAKGATLMGSKNGRFWMEPEMATKIFQENS